MSDNKISTCLINNLQHAKIKTLPWQYAKIKNCIPENMATSLANSFNDIKLTRCEQQHTEKSYRFLTASITEKQKFTDPAWKDMIDFFYSNRYRQIMTELTGICLEKSRITITAWQYQHGDWLAPHLDKSDKLVTLLIYLTSTWHEGDGGRLLILDKNDESAVVDTVAPRLGTGFILVRSQHSWHAVEKISSENTEARKSIAITFWKNNV